MSEILLIHGSCHGAWAWSALIPELQALGHSARAIDLPGSGEDRTPLAEVTLDAYADAIIRALGRDTVLLGHSASGFAITAAAERAPDCIARLIYLCAYLPVPGRSMLDLRKDAPFQPLKGALAKTADGLGYTVDPALAPNVFYQDCPPEVHAYAVPRLGPQAIAPQATVLDVSENSRKVPKSYILCENDATIPPAHQAAMTADWPRCDIHRIATGHSPFFAAPDRLAALIDVILTA